MVDWSHCPLCGCQDFEVASEETILGLGGIYLSRGEDGTISAEWSGHTEVIWDTSSTTGYVCTSCDEPLPRDYQDELAKALR